MTLSDDGGRIDVMEKAREGKEKYYSLERTLDSNNDKARKLQAPS